MYTRLRSNRHYYCTLTLRGMYMLTHSLSSESKNSLSSSIARLTLQLFGWKTISSLPYGQKFILIGAPHTSFWDFPLIFLYMTSIKVKAHWVIKDALILRPFRSLVRYFGALEFESSSQSSGFVTSMVERFNTRESMVLGLLPEGTSAFVPRWKTGFYYIALASKVPVVLGFIDYNTKTIGVGYCLIPSGDREKDAEILRDFYRGKQGKNPDRASPVKI